MTLDGLLSVLLDATYFAVFAITLVDYLRHRDRVRLAVVLLFSTLALVLGAPLVAAVVPALRVPLGFATIPALLGQPVLAVWLVGFVRPLPRLVLGAAIAAFVVIVVSFAALVALGAAGTQAVTILAIALLAYFLVLEGGAAFGFAAAARSRAGASRSRLLTAALATALLGVALIVLLGGSLAAAPGTPASATASVIVRVVAIMSALGYLAAFAPPRALRRISQQSIAYDFIRDLNAIETGRPVEDIWELLTRTATHASSARSAEVVLSGSTGAAAEGQQRISVAFDSQRWPNGRLELDLDRDVLFLDDDLELIGLLVDRTVRAAEREAFIGERERLITELQAASAAKSDFLAAMSHELRTPLNAIIGFSELLTEGGEEAADAPTVQTFAEHIHGSGLHLLELVNDVLDLARVEAGRLDLKPVRFDLDTLVRTTVAAVQPLADNKRHAIRLELASVELDADPSRIRQIVLNLLSNAIKFTDPGGEIRLSLAREADGRVRLDVADTGRGIGAPDVEKVFEAFHQADNSGTTTHHEGTGLGLALTRQLVEAHGGEVTLVSELGQGSTFTVRLPVDRGMAIGHEPPPALPADRPAVLVIEDDPAAQELLRVQLEAAGYAVLATASGRQGLAWAAEVRPDAVLLDILLPDLDGWEVLRRLKSETATLGIPVMVVSVVDDRQLGLALGAIDYFVKPVARETLLEALGRLTFTTKVRTRTVTALVIDADPDALGRYRQVLEPEGFRVIAATDGADGRRRASEDRPDLILLDAILPDVDCFELTAALRADPATDAIPIWLTTPEELAPEAKARLTGHVQGVLVRGEDALSALQAWLATGQRAAATPGSTAEAPGSAAAAPGAERHLPGAAA